MPPERRLTEAEIRRKTNKPIMEKKRRERINKCLDDLKSMVLTTMSENTRPNKLEKADILEMTVQYLKKFQAIKPITPGASSYLASKHVDGLNSKKRSDSTSALIQQRGYAHCVHEVTSFLSKTEGIPVEFRTKLLGHLADQSCRTQTIESQKQTADTSSPGHLSSFSHRELLRGLKGHSSSERLTSVKSFDTSPNFQNTRPEPIDIVQCRVSPLLADRFSPVSVSPTSYESSFSPLSYPSPTTLSLTKQNGVVGTQEEQKSEIFDNCRCPNDQTAPQHLQLSENNNLQDVSSDSGNWSSSSYPDSPFQTDSSNSSSLKLLQNNAGTTHEKETTQSLNIVWRPWSL